MTKKRLTVEELLARGDELFVQNDKTQRESPNFELPRLNRKQRRRMARQIHGRENRRALAQALKGEERSEDEPVVEG